jgi:putative endonuclease
MPKVFTSKTQKTGELGEILATKYLENNGFTIVERNYYKKLGEIDIIAKKAGILHFIEVKAVSHETNASVSMQYIKPEDNFTYDKARKFKKIVSYYLAQKHVSHETKFQIDLLAVYLDDQTKTAKIKPFWDIIL